MTARAEIEAALAANSDGERAKFHAIHCHHRCGCPNHFGRMDRNIAANAPTWLRWLLSALQERDELLRDARGALLRSTAAAAYAYVLMSREGWEEGVGTEAARKRLCDEIANIFSSRQFDDNHDTMLDAVFAWLQENGAAIRKARPAHEQMLADALLERGGA